MRLSLLTASLLAAASLCACNGDSPDVPEAVSPGAAGTAAAGLPPEWRIPERFHGEWHADLANCGDRADETELVIGPETLTFHESTGKVMASATSPRNDGLTIIAEMTGEGMTWRRAYVFQLSEEGQVITSVEDGPGLSRRRCPARQD